MWVTTVTTDRQPRTVFWCFDSTNRWRCKTYLSHLTNWILLIYFDYMHSCLSLSALYVVNCNYICINMYLCWQDWQLWIFWSTKSNITNCNARLVCSLYFSNDKNSMWADDDDMRYCTLLYGKHMSTSLLAKSMVMIIIIQHWVLTCCAHKFLDALHTISGTYSG